jgi:hypothetical protein
MWAPEGQVIIFWRSRDYCMSLPLSYPRRTPEVQNKVSHHHGVTMRYIHETSPHVDAMPSYLHDNVED